MRYHLIDTLGSLSDGYCIITMPPVGMGLPYYKMANGEPASSEFPENAAIFMTDQHPGTKVPSLIGNTQSYLMVVEPMQKVIEVACAGAHVEYLPFTLYNHKKRPHEGLYFIVNPIGVFDCLNLAVSEIERLNEPGDPYDGEVVGIDRLVIDPRKVAVAPALFRVKEESNRYVIHDRLAEALRRAKFTNLQLTEIELSDLDRQ